MPPPGVPPPEVDTPALLLDLDRVESNIERMARAFETRSACLRPHFKTPKCANVARLQLEAGAIGITCAKLGEAEVLAEASVDASVLIANEIIGAEKVRRLIALAPRLRELIVAVDHADQVAAIDAELRGTDVKLGALVEVDLGMSRCGTDAPEQTVALAKALGASRVSYRGIMGYEGHAVLVPEDDKRESLAREALARLDSHLDALQSAGLAPEIVSGGGTGTCDWTGTHPRVTEVQAGSYVFMDGAYRKVRTDFDCALTMQTTVLRRRGRLVINDCGSKALSQEFGMPDGFDLPVRYVGLSEEHGHLLVDKGREDAAAHLTQGARVRVLPSHGDTTINLHDRYFVFRAGELQGTWPIAARGRFR